MALILDGTNGLSDVDGSAATPAIRGSDANTGVFFGSDVVGLSTGGSERVRVDASGNLLVGTATTSTLSGYTVVGQFKNSIGIVSGSADEFSGALLRESSSSNSISLNADPGNLRAGSFLGFGVDGSERLRITDAGNVGIGTSSPSNRFVVSNGGANGFEVNPSAGNIFTFNRSTLSYTDTTLTANNIIFQSGGATERARIDSSGNLMIGGTVNFGFRFQVVSASSQSAVFFYRPTSTTTDNVVTVSSDVGGSGATRLVILASGNVQNVNNSYGAISDAKLKENIVDATPKLEKLNQVRVVNYNMIGDEQKQIGVIAQELEQIFPGMVEESPDRDAEGNDLGTTTKAVKYSVFVPMLIKAMQEMKAVIDSQAERIAALEAK